MNAIQRFKPRSKHRWYQFSLRSLMIFVTIFAICCSISTFIIQRHNRYLRSPSSRSFSTDYSHGREYQWIDCVTCLDHNKDVYYAVVEGTVDFDPNLQNIGYSFHDREKEGVLEIDNKIIEYSPKKRLLALNPFGEMEEIVLSPTEQEIVRYCQHIDRIWDIALQHLYRRKGVKENGVPVGHWCYYDNKGNLAYEGSYRNGKRDGKWKYYHENGRVRCEINYLRMSWNSNSKISENKAFLHYYINYNCKKFSKTAKMP